jgi:hypothetical protein
MEEKKLTPKYIAQWYMWIENGYNHKVMQGMDFVIDGISFIPKDIEEAKLKGAQLFFYSNYSRSYNVWPHFMKVAKHYKHFKIEKKAKPESLKFKINDKIIEKVVDKEIRLDSRCETEEISPEECALMIFHYQGIIEFYDEQVKMYNKLSDSDKINFPNNKAGKKFIIDSFNVLERVIEDRLRGTIYLQGSRKNVQLQILGYLTKYQYECPVLVQSKTVKLTIPIKNNIDIQLMKNEYLEKKI